MAQSSDYLNSLTSQCYHGSVGEKQATRSYSTPPLQTSIRIIYFLGSFGDMEHDLTCKVFLSRYGAVNAPLPALCFINAL